MAMPSRDYVEQYWDQGYAVLRGFLPKTALGELQAETRRLYAEAGCQFRTRRMGFPRWGIHRPGWGAAALQI
jgi:hypothetical protein